MFCPKCGGQNPENGKFCRTCGTDLGTISSALTAHAIAARAIPQPLTRKGKPVHWEGAITKFCTGLAFLIISIVLAFSRMGQDWWFWMLIPAFGSLGSGIAQFIQLRKTERDRLAFSEVEQQNVISSQQNTALPPPQTEWVAPQSRYKTGDLVPPSVTENTTRHLEIDSEGKTMTLPKNVS